MPINSKIKSLYDALKADGADVGSEQEFSDWFQAPGEQGYNNRKYVYDTFKADGADVGKNYEEFAGWLGLHAVQPQVAQAGTMRQPTGQTTREPQSPQQGGQQPAQVAPREVVATQATEKQEAQGGFGGGQMGGGGANTSWSEVTNATPPPTPNTPKEHHDEPQVVPIAGVMNAAMIGVENALNDPVEVYRPKITSFRANNLESFKQGKLGSHYFTGSEVQSAYNQGYKPNYKELQKLDDDELVGVMSSIESKVKSGDPQSVVDYEYCRQLIIARELGYSSVNEMNAAAGLRDYKLNYSDLNKNGLVDYYDKNMLTGSGDNPLLSKGWELIEDAYHKDSQAGNVYSINHYRNLPFQDQSFNDEFYAYCLARAKHSGQSLESVVNAAIDEFGNNVGRNDEAFGNAVLQSYADRQEYYTMLDEIDAAWTDENSKAHDKAWNRHIASGLPEDAFGEYMMREIDYRHSDPVGSTLQRVLSSPNARNWWNKRVAGYKSKGMDMRSAKRQATEDLQGLIEGVAMRKMQPKSDAEYVIRNGLMESTLGLLGRASLTSGSGDGGQLDRLEAGSRAVYGKEKASGTARVLGELAPFVTDLTTGIGFTVPNAAGSVAKKAITRLAAQPGKKLLGLTTKQAMRRVEQNLGVRFLGSSIGGAINFGIYTGRNTALGQISSNGIVDTDEFSKATGEALVNGFVFGTVGEAMGALNNGLKGGKVLLGEAATIAVEGTTFTALDAMWGDEPITAETWAKNFGMALGARAGNLPKYIGNLASRMRGDIGPVKSIRLSDESYNQIKEKYPTLAAILKNQSAISDLTQWYKNGSKPNEKSKAVAKQGEELFNEVEKELQSAREDSRLPWTVVRMAEWVLNGKVMPEPMVMNGGISQREDGRWEGITVDQNGRTIDHYDLGKNEKKANAWYEEMLDIALLNQVAIAEGLRNNKSLSDSFAQAAEALGANSPKELVVQFSEIYKKLQNNDKLTESEADFFEKVYNAVSDAQTENDLVNQVKIEIKQQQGIDIDNVLKKKPNKLTSQEKDALRYYLNEIAGKDLMGDQGFSLNNTSNAKDRPLLNSPDVTGKIADIYQAIGEVESRVYSAENGGDGMIHPAVLKGEDGSQVNIVSGNVVTLADGTIDVANSDPDIVVVDANGERQMVSINDIASVGEVVDPNAVVDAAVQANAPVTGVEVGGSYQVMAEDNVPHQVEVLRDNGNGTLEVRVDGAEDSVPMVKSQLEQMLGVEAATMQQPSEQTPASPEATNDMVEADIPEAGNERYSVDPNADGRAMGMAGFSEQDIAATVDYLNGKLGDREYLETVGISADTLDATSDEQIASWVNSIVERASEFITDATDEAAAVQPPTEQSPDVSNDGDIDTTVTPPTTEPSATTALATEEVADEVEAMPMLEDGNPDYSQVDASRAHDYLYSDESGLDKSEADEYVQAQIDAADKALSKIDKKPLKMGTDLAKYRAEKQRRQEQLDAAKANVDYWERVKAIEADREAQAAAERKAKDAEVRAQAVVDEQARQAAEVAKQQEQAERGAGAVHPAIAEKWDNAPKIEGYKDEVVLANGERVPGTYYLVESGAVTPSHNASREFEKYEGFPVDENGNTINDRDYERDKDAQNITRSIADKYDSRALQTPVIVSKDGVVLSGNGRTMAGELAASNNTDGAYIEHLKNYGRKYGFSPEQVTSMKHPRAVFVPDADMPYTTDTFAKFNAQEMKGQSKTEQAVKLGKVVDDATFNQIVRAINEHDTLGDFYSDTKAATEAINALRKAGAINDMQYAEMFDGDAVSDRGRQIIENMLIGKAFEGNPDVIRMLTEYKGFRQSVVTALNEISTNVALGKDYSLENELAQGIELAYKARKAGFKENEPVSPYATQLNLFPFEDGETVADYNNAAVLMLADLLNDKRPTLLKKKLQDYNQQSAESAAGQMDIFSGSVKDKREIIKTVLNTLHNGETEETQRPEQRGPVADERGGEASLQEDGAAGQPEQGESNIQGLESYSEDELRVIVEEHVRSAIADADMDAEITGIRFIGSRTTGTARADSDLDVLVEYKGTAREDSLFNVLNDEDNRLVIDGITVDINPITPGKSGTIEEFMKRNAGYKKETAVQAQIALAEQQTETSPSEAQKEAGNYKKGHVKIDGFDISIEQPKGSVRSGVDASGKSWRQKMNNTYGYIRGTEGVDGDHIDVFLSDDPSQGDVFVVDQVNNDGSFDEHKVMYGFNSEEEARQAYLSNYEDGWQGLGAITAVSKDEFKKWIGSSHRKTKPFAEYKNVKVGGAQPIADEVDRQNPTLFDEKAEKSLEEAKIEWENLCKPKEIVNFANDEAAQEKWVGEHLNEIVEKYIAANGNKLDPDEVRRSFAGMGYDGKNVEEYRVQEGIVVGIIYDKMLENAVASGNTSITLLTGVGGAGKSVATRKMTAELDKRGLVYDSAFNKYNKLEKAIKRAKELGMTDVQVIAVHNDALTAFGNTVNRGLQTGRFLALDYFLNDAFYNNQGKIAELQSKHPDVDIVCYDNSGNKGGDRPNGGRVSVEEATKWDYTVTDELLNNLLDIIENGLNERRFKPNEIAIIGRRLPDVARRIAEPSVHTTERISRLGQRIRQEGVGDLRPEAPREQPIVRRDRLGATVDGGRKGDRGEVKAFKRGDTVIYNGYRSVVTGIRSIDGKEEYLLDDALWAKPENLTPFDDSPLSLGDLQEIDEGTMSLKLFDETNIGDVFFNDHGLTATVDRKVDSKKGGKGIRLLCIQKDENAQDGRFVKIFNPLHLKQWLEANGMKKEGAQAKQETEPIDEPEVEEIPNEGAKSEQPKSEPKQSKSKKKAKSDYGSKNKGVSRDRYEELKKRMRKKLGGQMNMGVDPEILAIGTEMAAYHIEAGARRFADFAKRMIEDLGDVIRPYLKSFYNGARDLPEMAEWESELTPYDEVRRFDVANFDKKGVDAMATADHVIKEQQAAKDAEAATTKIKEKRQSNKKKAAEQQGSLFGDLFGDEQSSERAVEQSSKGPAKATTGKSEPKALPSEPRQSAETPTTPDGKALRPATDADFSENKRVTVYRNGEQVHIMMVMRSGTQLGPNGEFGKGYIESIYLTDGSQVLPSDLQVIDKRAKEQPKQDKDENVNLQAGSEEARGERRQPQQDEPLGEGTRNEAERPDGRGMGGRSESHPGDTSSRSGGLSRPSESEQRIAEPTVKKNTHNNRVERGKDYAPKDVDARIEANIAAIELMQKLIDSGKKASAKDMAVLRKFSGWGGLGKAFNENGNSYNPTARRLRELLGDEGYEQANMSRNSAYYTPAKVIDTLWDIAKAMGFKGGNVLEGSAGIGNILGLMPQELSERSDIHAVEIDSTSGNILSLLYPDAKVDIQGFEATKIPNGSVDLSITNVPFVTGLRVSDSTGDKDLSQKFHDIHDFCIAKNVRKLREGGIGIFITSSGTLDNSQKLRNWLVAEGNADVVGAFRLTNNTFGGTGATSDIIVVRKRVNGQKSPHAIDVQRTTGVRNAVFKTGDTKKVNGKWVDETKPYSMEYNEYFVEHPEMMGGEMKFGFEQGDTYRPGSKALYPKRGINQNDRLAEFVKSIAEKDWSNDVALTTPQTEQPKVYEELGENVKEGSMLIDKNGELCVASYGRAVPLDVNNNKVKGRTKQQCFKDYSAIKDAVQAVLDYQTKNSDDAGLKPLIANLNRAYDNFVKTYGHFHKNPAISFLRNDMDFSSVAALETMKESNDANGKRVQSFKKGDIFTKRVVKPETEPKPTNVKDGIITSIYKHGRVDIPYISEQLGKAPEAVKQEIINSGLGFENPLSREVEVSYEYLSGNVRDKLRQAQEQNENGEYDVNIKALEKVIPMNIPAHLIEFSLGSSWLAPKVYELYIKDRTDLDIPVRNVGGTWVINEPYYTAKEMNRAMGVHSEKLDKTIMGHELIAAAMQNKTVRVAKTTKLRGGGTETIVDQEATQACAAKIDEIRQDFKDWARGKMQSDPELSQQVEEAYNEQFNNYVPKEIPDEFVPEHFSGATQNITLRPHQAKAAIRATTQPLMLAHEVGSGKSFTLITTAMEMRRLGTARKPMVVVQNATLAQFVADAKLLYPNAKILSLEDSDRNAEGRKAFYAKIKYNDWDMIVIPQSTFEMIPDSEERQMAFVRDKIQEKMQVLEQLREAGASNFETKQAEKEISKLEDELSMISSAKATKRKEKDAKKEAIAKQNADVKAREMLDRKVDDVENFDEMGIDAILVDEAHEYKHLGFATAMQRGVKGVDPSYSKKAQGVYLKTQSVMERTGGKNVVFATGTPISNTAAEVWTFMRYLMPADVMKSYDIYYFDDFVRNFGNLTQMLEFTTSGKFKENNRFAGYVNLPELVRIWFSVADTVRSSDVGSLMAKIPAMEGDKAQDIYLPQTPALRSVMKYVKARLREYDNMSGKEKKANSHIPLTMYGIAKAAAVDARLVMNDAPDDPNSKTNEAVRQTMRSLKETAKYKGTVAIFADNYQNKDSGFNIYDDIKKKLVAEGVPENQVVVIKSGMSIKKKQEIFDKVNAGDIRVIMGSTFTLGTGVNIQERLHTLIHLDAPNRPMDYTQRNGRILRQGNLHKEWGIPVRVLRFGVEDSLDVTAYQRLKTKGAIVESIMNGKQLMGNSMENRTMEEEEDAFGDTVAQLSGSEYAMLKQQAEREVRKLTAKKKQHEADQVYIHNQKPRLEGQIATAKKRMEQAKKSLDLVKDVPKNPAITINKVKYPSVDAMAEYIKAYNKKVTEAADRVRSSYMDSSEKRDLTMNIGGFNFDVSTVITKDTERTGTTLSYVARRVMTYKCDALGLDGVPVKQALLRNAIEDIITNVLTGNDFKERIESSERTITNNESEIKQLNSREGKPFEFDKELAEAEERLADYEEKMKAELEAKEAKYAEMDADIDEAKSVGYTDEEEDTVVNEDAVPYGINQGFGSAGTSLNQVPSATKKINWEPGTVNVDIGGGKFDKATDYLSERGVENLVFDPFNRNAEHNKAVAERVRDEKVDTVTCNNVLNVIDSEASRANVILQAAKALKKGGTAYFSVYEGDKSGVGRQTKSDSWQNNRPTKDYVKEVEQYFDDVTLKNSVITARNPKPTDELSVWDFDGEYNGNGIAFERGSSYRSGSGDVIRFESHAEQLSLFSGGQADAVRQPTEQRAQRQRRASEMSDAELLSEMGRDIAELEKAGRADWGVQSSYSEEYDRRHIKEYNEECDRVRTMLDENNVDVEQAEQMLLDTIYTWREGYATADRSRLLAQFDTLNSYYAEKEWERDNADLIESEAAAMQQPTGQTADETGILPQKSQKPKRAGGFNPTEIKLRKLKGGETCYVERRYQESGSFDFTGSEKVESDADLAYIFRNLENSSIENTFLVLIKNGKATILHVGMGGYAFSPGHLGAGVLAASQLKPDSVIFVHNHPSGTLKPSQQDIALQEKVKKMFGADKVREAIIIDITSGKYSIFDSDGSDIEKQRPTSAKNEVPYKTYSFGQQVFAKDYVPDSASQITDSGKAAEFISGHRLGERDKLSLIVLNRQKRVTGNIFLPWTSLDGVDVNKAAGVIAKFIHQMGGESGILYGSGTISRGTLSPLARAIANYEVRLDDFINVEGVSAQVQGVLEEGVEYQPTAGNTRLLSVDNPYSPVGTPGRTEAVQRDLDQLQKKYNSAPVHLLDETMSIDDIRNLRENQLDPVSEEDLQKAFDNFLNGETVAVALPASREIVIFAHKVNNLRELERALFHENYHEWLIGEYGEEGAREICEHFLDAARDVYPELWQDVEANYREDAQAEEFMTYMVEYSMLRGELEDNVYRYLMPVDRENLDNFLNKIGYDREQETPWRKERVLGRQSRKARRSHSEDSQEDRRERGGVLWEERQSLGLAREEGVGYGGADDSGVSDEELAGYDAGRYSFAESITRGLVDLATKNADDQQLRMNAMQEFGGNLAKLQKLMNKQRAYDKATVDDIVRLTRMVMGNGFFKDMRASEVKRLLAAIKKGVGVEDLTPIANNVVDMLVQHQLRESKNMLHKLMQVRGRKVDARGVEVQAGLDIDGQRMMSALKDGMSLGENGLLTRINDCENRLGSEDEVIRKNAMSEYQGLMLAKEYHDNILSGEEEEIVLRQEKRQEQEKIYDFRREPVLDQDGNAIMNLDGSVRTVERKTLKSEFKNNVTNENKQLRRNTEAAIERIEQSIRESRMERVTAYSDFMSDVAGDVRASRERAAAWRAEQQERIDAIHHNANSDLEGVPVQSQTKMPEGGLLAFNSNNDIVRLLFQPLATFEKMLRFFGRKSHNGEGYLFNRFMRGWADCSDKEWRSKRAAHEELDAKVNELFGKKAKRWSDLYEIERNKKHPGIPVEYWDNGERVQETMSQGEALSLVVWSKQKDAEAGLRRMGISEEDIETIKSHLDPKFLELANWVVEEFLPKRRTYYNEVHERMFGAPMAAIEHYFPIVRNSRDVEKPSDITERDLGDTKPSTITGNIIKRQRTAAALDVHTDFFDHLLKHLDDMENWAAWAEFNRDINTLRNYKRFKNRVLNMHSVEFGSGKDLWKAFDDACAIAAGVYHPSTKRGSGDNLAVNVAKGVTGAKIAFRFYTAAKQLLSLPAFWNGDASLLELAKWENPVGAIIAWNWAMKNLPGFSKRWQSRQVGDVRLMDTDSDYAFWRNNMVRALSRGGMWANALVDGMTVAMGARAVYETRKKRYLRNGYSEEQAEKRAMQDAAINYNSSQQSSENAFLSSLQLDRTWWSTLMTVFRSASMGYQRRLTTGLRNLKNRMKKGYKAESIEFMKKQMVRDGIDEATAEKAARRTYRWGGLRSMADVFVFGLVLPFFWNLGPYALYLLMGDDDDEKKDMLKDAAVHSLFGPVEGLTGGQAMSEIGNTWAGYLMSDNDKSLLNALRYHDYLSMPLGSDLQQIFNEAGTDSMAAWTDAFNLLVQAGIGVNPETFTDAWVAIADACDGDPQTTKEFALCFMRVMQVPQTQVDKLFIDELGMTARDAQKLNAMEMADRYARYKKFRNAPLLNWAYSPDESQKVAEKYRKRFLDNMQERMERLNDEQLEWNFANPNDSERRKATGKAYAKGKGVKDTAGQKPASNWKPETRRSQLKYQRLRDWTDLAEDVLLDTAIEQAKNRGDDEKLKALRDAKKELTEIKRGKHTETWDVDGLGDGSAEDDKAIMDELRARRKELLRELGVL